MGLMSVQAIGSTVARCLAHSGKAGPHVGASNGTARRLITTVYADLASTVLIRQHLSPTNKLPNKIGFIY